MAPTTKKSAGRLKNTGSVLFCSVLASITVCSVLASITVCSVLASITACVRSDY